MSMKHAKSSTQTPLWRRVYDRKSVRIVIGLCLAAVALLYVVLPFALDRLDGTTRPTSKLPENVALEGRTALPTRFLPRPDGSIAFDDTGGAGPLVICVPSMGDLRQEYRYLAPQLADAGYRVVTMDVRGHGESSVDWADYSAAAVGSDIVALARKLNAGPAFVIGTSMAGGAAVWAAAEAPDLIAGQVLVDAFVRDLPSSFVDTLSIRLGMAGPWGPPVWGMYYKSLYPTAPPADLSVYIGALKANLKENGRFAALKKMIAASKSDIEARLDEVKSPTLVLMGTKDPDFKQSGPEAEARWLKERLHGELVMIDGAGHYPHAEMPAKTGPEIVAFLDKQRNGIAAGPNNK